MSKMVQCALLAEELPALEIQPYPGELGQKIMQNISAKGWRQWLEHQTMLINEHRLSPINPEHRKFLVNEMEQYFFGEGSATPEGYVPPEE